MLNSRLCDFIESECILSEEQHGFRSDRSCQDCILSLSSLVDNRQLEGMDTFACFIDLKKKHLTVLIEICSGRKWKIDMESV